MNIRPRAGETRDSDNPEHPPTQARFARAYFLPWGCSCPRPTGTALARPRNAPAMSTDPRRRDDIARRLSHAYDRANPTRRCRAHAARLLAVMFGDSRTSANEAAGLAAEGFGRDRAHAAAAAGRGRTACREADRRGAVCRARTACTCRRCSHEEPPPREGVRPRPRRAAGPQRQGPHRRLRARLERPQPPAGPTQRSDHPRLPGGPGGAAVGLPQRRIPAAASPATRRSPPRPSAAAIPSTRRSRCWSGPAC